MSAVKKVRDVVAPEATPIRPWRRCRELVDEIIARSKEPTVTLALGTDPIVEVIPGAIVLLIGGTGRGKTSLAATMAIEHAQGQGPAIAMSLELTADEWTARVIGTRCDASWMGVLRGEVTRERMIEVLPDRLAIIEREMASLDALGLAVDELRREYPGEPVLIVVDYAQLIGLDSEEDIRPRIGKVMRDIDRITRGRRAVAVVLSQGSRVSARALSSGEVIGAATTDAGAESADLERWATVTLAIGQHGEPSEDGSCAADLSIGKSRMGGGDRVLPARYYGRSGLWRITGDAKPASQVRAERETERGSKKQIAAELAMVAAAMKASGPLSVRALREAAHVRGAVADLAIDALKDRGELVEVHVRLRGMKRKDPWPLWTPEKAAKVANANQEDANS